MMQAWILFIILAVTILAVDIFIPPTAPGRNAFKRAATLCALPVVIALAYGMFLHFAMAQNPVAHIGATRQPAVTFSAGYLLELALSADNVMMFIILLRALKIPAADQNLVMFWAVTLAIAARVVLILTGLALMSRFHVLFYFMGAFLLLAGTMMFFQRHGERGLAQRLIEMSGKMLPISAEYSGRRMIVSVHGRQRMTPLLLAIILVGLVDVLFAFDSIPAVFGITSDPLIVTSSNVFAVLALHRLYFIMAPLMDRMRFLEAGLALILLFIGSKMLLPLVGTFLPVKQISTTASLLVIAAILLAAAGFSLALPAKNK
jgi:tellurite resistance protein TerC